MIKILFESNNYGKYLELVKDFLDVGIELVFYKDIQDEKLVLNETSEILFENAKSKAQQAAKQTGMMSLGDDSAICVRALDYFPGVHSRRWAFEETDDYSRNQKLLEYMKDEDDRRVYLISRFSLVDAEGNEIFKTVVKNKFTMTQQQFGEHGFGYDPILAPDGIMVLNAYHEGRINWNMMDTCITGFNKDKNMSIASLDQDTKNAINYRGKIAKEISDFLNLKYPGTLN